MTTSKLATPLTGLLGVLLAVGLVAGGAAGTATADEQVAPPPTATPEAPAPTDTTDAPGTSSTDGLTTPLSAKPNLVAGSVVSFRAGDIISDQNMYNGEAMDATSVQAFLTENVPACQNNNCIDIKSFTATPLQPANDDCTSPVAAGLTKAATIIAAVGKACGVSQKALLALIQKESSLIGNAGPSDDVYDHATFYGCDDSGSGCKPAYKGFFNQVYNAAQDLKNSQLHPPAAFPVGKTVDIAYNPDANCGTGPVTIRTVATAALYDYTPYQPNEEALTPDTDGDACSSLGNLNFWFVYTDWFGYPHLDVDRIQASDRYASSAAISAKAYPNGAKTVYIATGTGYADALSAGPAAVEADAPLLLTMTDALPDSIVTELKRLAPTSVVIVGGPNSVSPAVQTALGKLLPGAEIDRITGADRYEVSRKVADKAFHDGATGAYIATGLNFPDALSASGAGGHAGMPIILVNGSIGTLDSPTADLLTALGVTDVTIAGGPNSVPAGIQSGIDALPDVKTVQRINGADRYATSLAINQHAYGNTDSASDTVFLATGENFPDALAGSALAGSVGAPLIVVPGSCVPQNVKLSFNDFDNTKVTLLGGPNSLSDAVQNLISC